MTTQFTVELPLDLLRQVQTCTLLTANSLGVQDRILEELYAFTAGLEETQDIANVNQLTAIMTNPSQLKTTRFVMQIPTQIGRLMKMRVDTEGINWAAIVQTGLEDFVTGRDELEEAADVRIALETEAGIARDAISKFEHLIELKF